MLREDFLHFIWKNKLFSTTHLVSVKGKQIEIINGGTQNSNAGPDFFNAILTIDGQKWAGNIELHSNASDWYVHHHENDKAYSNIILHVVWNHDMAVYDLNNNEVATLELKKFVDKSLLASYYSLFTTQKKWINCENSISEIDNFTLSNWLEKLYIARLEQRSNFILELLKSTQNDWEAVLFRLLFRSFGLKVNADAFYNLSSSIAFSVVRKCTVSVQNLESLFFGQGNLLNEEDQDAYHMELQNEYAYLKHKFELIPIYPQEIKFFRLRPNNFPTIRVSQLANLYVKEPSLFSKIITLNTLADFYKLFAVGVSEYWKDHYTFGVTSKKSDKKLTKSFIDLLLINTIIPLKFIYQKHTGNLDIEGLLSLISSIKPEKNTIITKYNDLGIVTKSAFETQALLELNKNYCMKNNCLNCAIGNKLLKQEI